MSQFDDVTVGYPISEEGHLKSIYTGNFLILLKVVFNIHSLILNSLIFHPDISPVSGRKSAKTQPSAAWPVGKRALSWRQPEQQQLWYQPQVLAQSE